MAIPFPPQSFPNNHSHWPIISENPLNKITIELSSYSRVLHEMTVSPQSVMQLPTTEGSLASGGVPTPSHITPVQHTPHEHSSFAFLPILLSRLPLRLISYCESSGFHITTLQAFLYSSMSATCSAHLILLGYVTLIIQISFFQSTP